MARHNDASGSRLLDMALEDGAPRSPLSGLFPANLPLPSLEEALMPHSATLPHLHPSTGPSVKIARKQAKRAQAKHPDMTLDECIAIVLYTMEEITRETSLYFVLNLALRNKVRAAVRPWRDYIWLLLHALRKLPPSTEVTVFRGCKKSPVDLGIELTKDFEFTWSSFSSTATTQGVMQTFVGQSGPRTLMTIKMAENSGRDVRDFSLYPGENEILFPPNMCFEVVDSFDAGNQLIMVQCRQTQTVDVILDLNSAGKTGSFTQPPALRFKLNERVECRDRGQNWQVGTVVSVEPLKVKPDGDAWAAGYAWDEVRVLSPEAAGPPKVPAKAAPAPQPPPSQPVAPLVAPLVMERESHTGNYISGCCVSSAESCLSSTGSCLCFIPGCCLSCIYSFFSPDDEQVKHFRGPCAACCKPLAPCCCVSADGEAIFGCVPTDRYYFLPACLHMALCPQLGCDPKGGAENGDCIRLCLINLLSNLFVCCLQSPSPLW